jgi:hypothetical protein
VTVAPAAGGASIRFSPAGYDAATRTVTFAAAPGTGRLADGNYHATLSRGALAGAEGTLLPADAGLDFFVLAGDVNHDGTVGAGDFNVLASHFGQSGQTWATGDFDGDGVVGPGDFNLLASRFGTTLAPPPAPAPIIVTATGSLSPLPTPATPAPVGAVKRTVPRRGANAAVLQPVSSASRATAKHFKG